MDALRLVAYCLPIMDADTGLVNSTALLGIYWRVVLRVAVDHDDGSLFLGAALNISLSRRWTGMSFRKCVFAIALCWVLPRESVNERKSLRASSSVGQSLAKIYQ